jgi:hypothetical protein
MKNKFLFQGTALNPGYVDADLKALALTLLYGEIEGFSENTDNREKADFGLSLPFSLSNLDTKNVKVVRYSSAATGVNEYADQGYPKKGDLFVGLVLETNLDKVTKDLDNYVRWEVDSQNGLGSQDCYIVAGIISNTQTEFYTPFSAAEIILKVFYNVPREAVSRLIGHGVMTISQAVENSPNQYIFANRPVLARPDWSGQTYSNPDGSTLQGNV